MRLSKLFIISTTFLVSMTTVNAAELKGCAAKQQEIETQLKYAQTYGNAYRIRGLERALEKNKKYCNDAHLNVEREQKVLEKERKVSKIQSELQQEQQKGDLSKVAKKQEKLEKAEQELKQAKLEYQR